MLNNKLGWYLKFRQKRQTKNKFTYLNNSHCMLMAANVRVWTCMFVYWIVCWRWLTCRSVECLIMPTDLYCRIAFKYYDFIRFHRFVLIWFYANDGARNESTFDICDSIVCVELTMRVFFCCSFLFHPLWINRCRIAWICRLVFVSFFRYLFLFIFRLFWLYIAVRLCAVWRWQLVCYSSNIKDKRCSWCVFITKWKRKPKRKKKNVEEI